MVFELYVTKKKRSKQGSKKGRKKEKRKNTPWGTQYEDHEK